MQAYRFGRRGEAWLAAQLALFLLFILVAHGVLPGRYRLRSAQSVSPRSQRLPCSPIALLSSELVTPFPDR